MQAPGASIRRDLEEAAFKYAAALDTEECRDYLMSRGILKKTADSFRLGYVENPLVGHEHVRGSICIPYVTNSGVVSVRFRRIPNEDGSLSGPKYLSLPGDPPRPFNTQALSSPAETVYICEGELDTIISSQVGLCAVGFPGTQSWKSYHARLFRFRKVVILADGDPPGLEFAETVAGSIPGAKIVQMPKGHDVNSFYLASGEDGIKELLGLDGLDGLDKHERG